MTPSEHRTKHPPSHHQTGGAERIAVGVDGSPEGRDAAVLAATIAQATGGEIMLVAVGSGRRGTVAPVLHDSTGEALMANASSPVMVVPRPRAAHDPPAP